MRCLARGAKIYGNRAPNIHDGIILLVARKGEEDENDSGHAHWSNTSRDTKLPAEHAW